MKSVLITGAAGFVGARTVEQFTRDGWRVTPLTRSVSPAISVHAVGIDLSRADHIDALAASQLTFDAVVHLAGRVEIALVAGATADAAPEPGPVLHPARLYADNVVATANVVELCERMGIKHLIFASSQTVYGLPMQDAPFTETSPCRPLEHYANSKRACEMLLEVASRRALAVTVLRFPGVFSEARPQGVVRRFCEAGLQEHLIVARSEFPLPIDVLHVDDLVDAIGRAATHVPIGCRVFNIATGEPCSLPLLADAVAGQIPHCRVRVEGALQPVVRMDASLAERELGWRAAPQHQRLTQVLDSVRQIVSQ